MGRRNAKPTGKYRSQLEAKVGAALQERAVPHEYETLTIPYTQPEKSRRYTPDFVLPNGIVIEVKGQFTSGNRSKHIMVRDSWPKLDIRFVFGRSNNRISKRSKTTYAKWCDTHGFMYADQFIPVEWIREEPNEASLAALAQIREHRLNR